MPQGFQCINCKHYIFGRFCDAFPEEIPMEIYSGEFDHALPYPDAKSPQDNGIRFEPLEDAQ